jgi:hypothetical protein
LGPYEVDIIFDNGTVKIITIDEDHTLLLINGHQLHVYHHPLSREAFVKTLNVHSNFEIVGTEALPSVPATT